MAISDRLIPWLKAQRPDVRFATRTPADLQDVVPAVRVMRLGGGANENQARFDAPRLVFECYDRTVSLAGDLADDIDRLILGVLPNKTIAGSVVTKTRQVSRQDDVPYSNPALFQFVTSHELFVLNT